jgi:hypothetical protein
MKKYKWIIGLLLITPLCLFSQTEEDSVFVKSLLLSDRTEESSVAFCPDGTYMYFSRKGAIFNFGKDNHHDIWQAKRSSNGQSWSAPVNSGPLLNTAASEKIVSINASADRLYFSRLIDEREILFVADKEGRRWGSGVPVRIPGLDSFLLIKSYFVSADEQVLLCCAATDPQEEADIYYCLKNADKAWTTPTLLRLPFQEQGDEITAFMAAGNRQLFFASNGPNQGEHYDLYYSERMGPSWQNWSSIRSLGPAINTPANEYGLAMPVSGDIIAYISDARSGQAKVIYGSLPADFLSESNKE